MNTQIQMFPTDNPPADIYLARYAEIIFWLARYLERAENLARLLEVTQTFTAASQNAQNWASIISLHEDGKTFAQRYRKVDAQNAIRFYLTDDTHPNSVMSCLNEARNNASALRAVISTETWVQVNVMYNDLRACVGKQMTLPELGHILSRIRRQCQTHYGISEGGLYRDQGWYFYTLGKQIERADQTTRLLDIKYHLLLPHVEDVGSTIDASQWFALLRTAGAYHAFRREHPYVISPATVAGFLLSDRRFPRSVACSLKTISDALFRLKADYGLPGLDEIMTLNEGPRQQLKSTSVERIISAGLHEYLDHLQLHLISLTATIGQKYFG